MSLQQKILFISHDANRAGAQLLLLRFLKGLSAYPQYKFKILLRHGGPLVRDFEKIAPVYHWYQREHPPGRLGRLLNRKTHQEQILAEIKEEKYDLIVSNTVTNGYLLAQLREICSARIVTYLHELPMGILLYTEPTAFNLMLRHTNQYWACSEAQKKVFVERFSIHSTDIQVIKSMIPEAAWNVASLPDRSKDVRLRLEIPENALVVGASGTLDWRKGSDIFVQLARLSPKETHFIWIGGDDRKPEFHLILEDLRRLNLTERVHLLPHCEHPYEYMALFDVFVLTSREEPYPLVALEAALLAKPILCFEGAGGAADLVANGAGIALPYLDISGMSKALQQLLSDEKLRTSIGKAAQEKVKEQHNDTVAMESFIEVLNASFA